MIRNLNPWRRLFLVVLQIATVFSSIEILAAKRTKFQVMAPLYIGRFTGSERHLPTEVDWQKLRAQLKEAKNDGYTHITSDIWWGLIQHVLENQYDWTYYDHLVQIIEESGLHWGINLSMHQLGGNVGDVGHLDIPLFLWTRYHKDPERFKSREDMMFKSEYGNLSKEYISFWATPLIKDDIKRFMTEFRNHFKDKAHLVDEINISMGPSGELRYPSYNQHDPEASYPSRGAIQAYSEPAKIGFREWLLKKYGNLQAIKSAWGFNYLTSVNQIFPPDPKLLKDKFWSEAESHSAYGRDFFDYYNDVLIEHGKLIFDLANEVFGETGSPFANATLTGKIPGIHWRIAHDRAAELSAGLIRSSYDSWCGLECGYGYKQILTVFQTPVGQMKRALTFTALEMSDNRDPEMDAGSRAKTLVKWISKAAHEMGIETHGENALAGELDNPAAWTNMFEAITKYNYRGITILRLEQLIGDETRQAQSRLFIQSIREAETAEQSEGPLSDIEVGEKVHHDKETLADPLAAPLTKKAGGRPLSLKAEPHQDSGFANKLQACLRALIPGKPKE